jgi:hypothetical protein
MKIFAATAIVLNTVFMALVGIHMDNGKSTFEKNHPWFYDNLSLLGLKVSEYDGKVKLTHDKMLARMKEYLYGLAGFLIMAILIYSYFKSLENHIDNEDSWS